MFSIILVVYVNRNRKNDRRYFRFLMLSETYVDQFRFLEPLDDTAKHKKIYTLNRRKAATI